jgi:exosortase
MRSDVLPRSFPPDFAVGLLLSAAFMAFTAWDQSYWWRAKEDYYFGWLVPFLVLYVIHDRWPRILNQIRAARTAGIPEAGAGRWWLTVVPIGVIGIVVAGSLLFLSGAFYRSVAGVTHLSTFAIALGTTLVVLATIYVLAPAGSATRSGRVAQRLAMAGLFVFPALVWLISAPLLSSIDNNLAVFLMQRITDVVFFVFDGLGLTLEQRGNILLLPSGHVGVEEACSGIRSLTGCLFSGSIIAAVYASRLRTKLLLMSASVLFALFANLIRSLFLTGWAYFYGAQSIAGAVHDISGYAVLGGTVAALFMIVSLLSPKAHAAAPAAAH